MNAAGSVGANRILYQGNVWPVRHYSRKAVYVLNMSSAQRK